MQELVLQELKLYFKEINSKYEQKIRKMIKGKGLYIDTYYKKKQNPLIECSENYLDDKDFIKKAIKIDPNSIKYASRRLRQDKTIAKVILKKNKKLAEKYIFKKTLKEIKNK